MSASVTPAAATPAADSLLLHVCCGPCSIMPVRRLQDAGYAVTAWFMNPNIQPLSEYFRRREAAGECAERLGIPILYEDAPWNLVEWLRQVAGRDLPPERCRWCCTSRMEAAWAAARALGYAHFSSSLLYSRYQPHEVIAAAGFRLCGLDVPAALSPAPSAEADAAQTPSGTEGPRFVYRDFRTDWQAGIDASLEWGVYRQPYCGCVYSEAERYHKKLQRLVTAGQQKCAAGKNNA